jgi:FtsH-binding integral membrane protein
MYEDAHMAPKAPWWRPVVMVTLGYGYWLARQTPQRLEARSTLTYILLAGMLLTCGLIAWGTQRLLKRVWPWYVEMFALLGLMFLFAWIVNNL